MKGGFIKNGRIASDNEGGTPGVPVDKADTDDYFVTIVSAQRSELFHSSQNCIGSSGKLKRKPMICTWIWV